MEVALLHAWNCGHSVSDEVFRAWSRLWPEAEQQTTTMADQGMMSGEIAPEYSSDLLPMTRNFDLILSTSPEASRMFPHIQSRLHLCYLPHAIDQEAVGANFGENRISSWSSDRFSRRLPVARHVYLAPWRYDRCPLPEQVTHWVSASRSVRELNGLPTSLQSLVLYPPINTTHFRPSTRQREGFYLCVCRDRLPEELDLAVEACRRIGKQLVIVASPELAENIPDELQSLVQVFQKDSALAAWYNRCAGVIFPGVVDYDSALIEAQACGAPVIAFREGSAVELVIDGEESRQGTGLFFDDLSVESLVSTLEELERRPQQCSTSLAWSCAMAYSERQFEKRTLRLLREVLHGEGQRTLERELRLRGRDAA